MTPITFIHPYPLFFALPLPALECICSKKQDCLLRTTGHPYLNQGQEENRRLPISSFELLCQDAKIRLLLHNQQDEHQNYHHHWRKPTLPVYLLFLRG